MVAIRRHNLRIAYRRLGRLCPPRARGAEYQVDPYRALRIVRAVNLAADVFPSNPSCLEKSIVIDALLHNEGLQAHVCIGVRSECGAIHAHAWVDLDGVPLNESPQVVERFAVFEGAITPALLAAMK
jgi:hypothetical protein